MAIARGSGTVSVTNINTNITEQYSSVSQAAKALGTSHVTLGKYIKMLKIFV